MVKLPKLMSTNSVADMFEVTPETVRDWINSGKLQAVKVGRQWRVEREEAIRFANLKYGE